jgi:S-methylmethionine-dependent homocysteine/selenocysteine methylase
MLPVFVSFVCTDDGRLLSGESIESAVQAILPIRPAAMLINCVAAGTIRCALRELMRTAPDMPVGCYANIGRADATDGWFNTDEVTPDGYAALAQQCLAEGAVIIGGCCGTTPQHVRKLKALLSGD